MPIYRIRQIVEEKGLDWRMVARKASIPPKALEAIADGMGRPSVKTVERIATAIGVPFTSLFE